MSLSVRTVTTAAHILAGSWGTDASNLKLVSVFNDDPNDPSTYGGGISEANDGPAADSNGNLYVSIANGPFEPSIGDYGDSALSLNTSSGLSINTYFTPADQASLIPNDLDFGVGGLVLLPNNELITAGKEGTLYLLNRSSMGGYQQGPGGTDNVLSELSIGSSLKEPMAYYNGLVYVGGNGNPLQAYSIANNGIPTLSLVYSSSNTFPPGQGGSFPSAQTRTAMEPTRPSRPTAPATGSSGRWTTAAIPTTTTGPSSRAARRCSTPTMRETGSCCTVARRPPTGDQAGVAVKFTAPVVANGLVYVGGEKSVTVYGEVATAAPSNLAATAGNGQVRLSWTGTSGATSYNVYRGTTSDQEALLIRASAARRIPTARPPTARPTSTRSRPSTPSARAANRTRSPPRPPRDLRR